MIYNKDDLFFKDYHWDTKPDDSKLKNLPDRNQFQSSEGNEVLYLLNHFVETNKVTDTREYVKIEMLIHDRLPIGKLSQITALRWLQLEYDKQGVAAK